MKKSVRRRSTLSWLSLLYFTVLTISARSQAITTLRGKVLNEKGGNMEGVTVNVAGMSHVVRYSTSTDREGNFSIAGVDNTDIYTLVFSSIGYKKDTIVNFKAGGKDLILVRMQPQSNQLSDVVVVGYGTQSRGRVTGAISSVKGEELNKYAGSSFAQQLSGKLSGVLVNDASAQPGTDPQIIIRGISTLTAGTFPLVVVDGFPLSEGSSLNAINPQDIETIDVLKDPSSAAIYGSRAANGVILVTTRSGRAGKNAISFDVYYGIQQRADKVKLLDAYQYAVYSTEARDWGYVGKNPAVRKATDDAATRKANGATARDYRLNYIQPYLNHQSGLTNTNWLDALFQTAPMYNANLNFSGGNDKTNYYITGNYFDQQGIVVNTGLKRYSGQVKVSSRPADWLSVGISMNPSYNQQNYFNNSGASGVDPIYSSLISYPFFPVYHADGSLAISTQIAANTPEDGALEENPVAIMKMTTYNRNYFRNFGNAFLEFKVWKDLTFKTMLGGDFRSTYINYYSPSNVGGYRVAAPKPASAMETNGYNWNYITENTLTYRKSLGRQDLNLLAGYSFQKENGNSTEVDGTNIPDDNLQNIAGATSFSAIKDAYTWTQLSWFGRLQYAYANRYLFTAALRRDGSSRFGANTKYGNFPSLTAGWVVSSEGFMQRFRWLDLMKLRVSWGKDGNNQIGSYGSQALVNQDNYVYGSSLAPGYAASAAPNPNLSWEIKEAANIGFDMAFLKHFSAAFNYYKTTTSRLLLNVPVPEQSGFSSSLQNIGKIQNKGLELEIAGHDIRAGALVFGFSGNLSTNNNKVLALAPGQSQILTGTSSAFLTRVGLPIAEMYGYDVTGVFKTQDQIDHTPHMTGTVVGDYMMRDINGDGQITTADRKTFGTYAPKMTYSFAGSIDYKGFNLSFTLTGLTGRKIYDRSLWLLESGESFGVGDQYYFKNRFDPTDNPNGFLGRPTTNLSANRLNAAASNQFFYNANYLRIRDVQLGYSVTSRGFLNRLGIRECRLYVTANNLFTFTPYRGFNPDATTTANVLTSGYTNSGYPVARSFVMGLHLSL